MKDLLHDKKHGMGMLNIHVLIMSMNMIKKIMQAVNNCSDTCVHNNEQTSSGTIYSMIVKCLKTR